MGELLAEKARVAEEEAALLGKKASDAEEEIKRLRLCVSKVLQSHLTAFPKPRRELKIRGFSGEVNGVLFLKSRDVWKCYKKHCLECSIHLPNRNENKGIIGENNL